MHKVEMIRTRATLPGVVRWYGGKGNMLQKLLPLIPRTPVYVEPYGGAASIMTNLPPAKCEVYNDADGRLVNLFRVIQNLDQRARLLDRLRHTPYSLDEFCLALEQRQSDDPVEAAWGFYVSQNQGFSGTAATQGSWSRAFTSCNGMAATCSRWLSRKASLEAIIARFERVQIDHRCALECIQYWDCKDATFYLDPPYVPETRMPGNVFMYDKETDNAHHEKLLNLILGVRGCVVISGYDSSLYAVLDRSGWHRIEFKTAAHSAGKTRNSGLQGKGSALEKASRTEVVWLNERAALKAGVAQMRLDL